MDRRGPLVYTLAYHSGQTRYEIDLCFRRAQFSWIADHGPAQWEHHSLPAAGHGHDFICARTFDRTGYIVSVPYWLICLMTALAPATRLTRQLLRKRDPPGLCPECGYDLRASKTELSGMRKRYPRLTQVTQQTSFPKQYCGFEGEFFTTSCKLRRGWWLSPVVVVCKQKRDRCGTGAIKMSTCYVSGHRVCAGRNLDSRARWIRPLRLCRPFFPSICRPLNPQHTNPSTFVCGASAWRADRGQGRESEKFWRCAAGPLELQPRSGTSRIFGTPP